MATDCPYLQKCPIFAKFANEGFKNFWIAMYCRGPNLEGCARKKMRDAGQEVPLTLLPSGSHLDALGD